MKTLIDLVTAAPPKVLWTGGAILAILALLLFLSARKAYRYISPRPIEDTLTVVAAGIATGVSAQGMWRFAGDILGLDGPLRLLLFAFIEVAIVTSAVRARRNMRASAESAKTNTWETPTAGADGIAVWVLTVLTAVLSSMDARSLAEAMFRLAAPLVAAWLWERGMAVERKRITGLAGINWAITPERVLVRVGLAEAKGRATTEVDAHQKLTRVALAAKKVHQLGEANASKRKITAAIVKRDRALDQAVEHTGLARDEVMQMALLDLVTTLGGGDSLTAILESASAPWSRLDHPAVTPAGQQVPSDFARLADETRLLNEGLAIRHGDRDAIANLAMLAAMATGNHLVPVTPGVTVPVTHAEVTPQVTKEVTDPPFFAPHEWLDEAADVTSGVTDSVTVERVTDQVTDKVTFDVTDRSLFDLRWPPLELTDVTPAVTPGVTTDEVTDKVTEEVTATAVMRAHWDANVAKDVYPSPTELAEVGGLRSHSYPSRLRKEWVAELPWRQRLKANAKPKKPAVNGSK